MCFCRRECISTGFRKTKGDNNVPITQKEFQAHRPLGKLQQLQTSSVVYQSKHHCLVCENMFNWKSQYKLVNASNELYQHHNYYVYKFDVSKYLRINITLSRIYFSHSTSDCFFGHLRFWNNRTAHEMKHCGVFSQLQFFLPDKSIDMSVETRSFVVANIEKMIYAVVDVDIITTTRPIGHQNQLVWILRFGHNRTVLNIYHVTVNHLYHILIKTKKPTQAQLKIYDGPGIHAPGIAPFDFDTTTQFASTSFQLVIHAAGFYILNYLKVRLEPNIKLLDSIDLHSPQQNIYQNTGNCIVHINAGEGFTVNASHNWLTQKGNYFTSNCMYSGVVFLTVNENIITTECVRYEVEMLFEANCLTDKSGMYAVHASKLQEISYVYPKSDMFTKNIYSEKEMHIVLFSSEGYSLLDASLHISKVGCAVTLIQLCDSTKDPSIQILTEDELYQSCMIVQLNPWQGSNKDMCVKYLPFEKRIEWTPHNRREVVFTLDGFIAGDLIFHLNLYWRNLQLSV